MSSNPSIRLLIAEDEQNLGMVLYKEMSRLGHQVTLVHDAEAAIRTARESEFDVALLDIMMPGRSGLEVLRELRQSHPDLRTIILSASATAETVERCFREGASGYLWKMTSDCGFSPPSVFKIASAARTDSSLGCGCPPAK